MSLERPSAGYKDPVNHVHVDGFTIDVAQRKALVGLHAHNIAGVATDNLTLAGEGHQGGALVKCQEGAYAIEVNVGVVGTRRQGEWRVGVLERQVDELRVVQDLGNYVVANDASKQAADSCVLKASFWEAWERVQEVLQRFAGGGK